VFYHC